MTNKERFLKALYGDTKREKLLNFKLFEGTDREALPDDVYGSLADVIVKDRMGLLHELDLEEMEEGLPEITLEDIQRI